MQISQMCLIVGFSSWGQSCCCISTLGISFNSSDSSRSISAYRAEVGRALGFRDCSAERRDSGTLICWLFG